MLKKTILLTALISFVAVADEITPDNFNNIQVVDKPTAFVDISLTDVSRVYCPEDIKWFSYSKEKEIEIQQADKNLLIKILPKIVEENGKTIEVKRSSVSRELLLQCGDMVYTIIMTPRPIPTQSIVINIPFSSKKKAAEFERANPYEDLMKTLIEKAYREEAIEGYEMKKGEELFKKFKQLDMYRYMVYKGAVYKVEVFKLRGKDTTDLSEEVFLPYLKDALAISLSRLRISAGEEVRLIVVSKEDNKE